MPRLLTDTATILCPHFGVGKTIASTRWWSINGGFVTVDGDHGSLACFNPTPCRGYTLRSMNLNATRINGIPALLETDINFTETGLPLKIQETHSVHDHTTPAPLPPGATSGPIAPALLDVTVPVVTAAPPTATFNTATSLPSMLAVVFTMTAAFPLQWVLARISTIGTKEILTSGSPAGATVIPSGGAWDQPSQTVTLNMPLTYLQSLGVGVHEFYMTAVNQRGRFTYTIFTLTVS